MAESSLLPPSPIHRILIFHLTLPERCLGGESLGEGASVQEISEQILYYHRDQKWDGDHSGGFPTPRTKNSLTEEAVQFLGLCSALYSLPSSFGGPELTEEKTKQIFFGKSTLVFVSLESSPHLLAVAQISRLFQQGSKAENGGGNPLAVRTSIERCHKLFCLLRGGGVLRRLEPSYARTGELYRLLKKIRKEKESSLRSGISNHEATEEQRFDEKILELQKEVKALRKKLPVQSIRRDLDMHYKEYLAHQGLVMTRNGGAGRCLVETVPEPILRANGAHALPSSSPGISTYTVMTLGLSTRRLLDELDSNADHDLCLHGVTTFVDGQFLHAHWSPGALLWLLGQAGDGDETIDVSCETICLLMRHIASYSVKISPIPSSRQDSNTSSHSDLGIKSIAMAFRDIPSQFESSSRPGTNEPPGDQQEPVGCFVPPPPQFMLSTAEEATYIQYQNAEHKAWALNVCLPLRMSTGRSVKEVPLSTTAVVYEIGAYTFLLFLELKDQSNESSGLSLVESRLKEMVLSSEETERDTDFLGQPTEIQWTEPGQDVVIVDRDHNKLYLLSDRKHHSRRDNKQASPAKHSTRRFLGFGPKSLSSSGERDQNRSTHLEWANLGLDCRHLLASHLHLDTMLAFDDMMNEIALRKRSKRIDNPHFVTTANSVIELCTCIVHGWIYACATEEMELYAFFDSSIYVTVADVQGAATKIQQHFFGQRK